jgi:HSP20 family protein
MTTLTRHHSAPVDFGDWMKRLFDDRLVPDRFFAPITDKDTLSVEEFVDGGALVVRAEMPGIDPEKDVEISIHDGLLHIRAERRESSEHEDKSGFRSEFHYGMFERILPLPAGAGDDDVKATYKDGILEIRLPQPKQAQAAKVPVTRLP